MTKRSDAPRWNDQAIGQVATDAVEVGFLTMPEADSSHPAWFFWKAAAAQYRFPFIIVQRQPFSSVASVGVARFGVAKDSRAWKTLEDLMNEAARSSGCRIIEDSDIRIAGPLSTVAAITLASQLASSSGVTFPLNRKGIPNGHDS